MYPIPSALPVGKKKTKKTDLPKLAVSPQVPQFPDTTAQATQINHHTYTKQVTHDWTEKKKCQVQLQVSCTTLHVQIFAAFTSLWISSCLLSVLFPWPSCPAIRRRYPVIDPPRYSAPRPV